MHSLPSPVVLAPILSFQSWADALPVAALLVRCEPGALLPGQIQVLFANQHFENLTGLSLHDLPTLQSWFDRIVPQGEQDITLAWLHALDRMANGQHHTTQIETGFRRAQGDILWLQMVMPTLAAAPGGMATLVFHDLSARRRTQHQLEVEARTDPLTRLLNRRGWLQAAQREIDRAAQARVPPVILTFDLDNFKQLNDQHGHAAGDSVLQALGFCLQNQLRSRDLVARWGGDEFIVMLPNTPSATAEQVAQRLADKLRHLVVSHPGAPALRVTMSIGVATHQLGESLHDTVTRADLAMYRAKRDGRNRIGIGLPPPSANAG